MSKSPRLGLSYILPQQAQKHVTANDAFRRLDALVQLGVKSASIAVEPLSPVEGDAYILPLSASGAQWGAMTAHSIAAFQDGEWLESPPRAGWRAYVEDAATFHVFDGAAWMAEAGGGASGATTFGVNATADATNRLAVKSDAALLSHDDVTPGSGDARQIINKASSANTASVVFQNGYSGRAEFGLNGDDDFSLKVSGDGANWKSAIIVEKDDANVGIGGAPSSARLTVVGEAGFAGADFVLEKDGYAGFQNFDVYAGTSIYYAPYFQMRRARGSTASPLAVADGDWVGGVAISAYAPSGAFVTRARMQAIVNGAPSGSTVPVDLAFYAGASSDSERMRIASSGNVGIGKSAPTTKLDIDGPVRVKSYAKAALPSASGAGAGAIAHVSDEAGGSVLAFSDGSNWRRVTDRAVVS